MSVWEALNSFFGRSPLKEAAEQWGKLAAEYKEELKELRLSVRAQGERIHELEMHEAKCQEDCTKYLSQIRDLREQLIFLTRGKNTGKGEDYPSY